MTSNPNSPRHAVLFSDASDDWPTPQDFFDRLNAEFEFGLDVCADRVNAKAAAYYGLDHSDPARRDALNCDWVADAGGAAVWMNPPYGRFGIKQFMAKAVEAARKGATVVCLVPARTDTKWWHSAVHESTVAVEVRFVKGRLRFGGATASAPFPSAVLVFGPGTKGTFAAMPNRGRLPRPVGQMELFDDSDAAA